MAPIKVYICPHNAFLYLCISHNQEPLFTCTAYSLEGYDCDTRGKKQSVMEHFWEYPLGVQRWRREYNMKMVIKDKYYERRCIELAPIMTNVGHWYQ